MLPCIGQAYQETFVWIYDTSPCKIGTLFYGGTAMLGLASSLLGFRDHRHITLGWTSPDEWSARRRDLPLTTHNIHKRHTTTSPVGFSPRNRAVAEPKLRPSGNWDRFLVYFIKTRFFISIPIATVDYSRQ